ncbi:MAG: beta-propeller domain-containing protein [Coriobacteriia bacterium]|nr:beta-propeller domain-containing protein [Coriobacteriia bacterium]
MNKKIFSKAATRTRNAAAQKRARRSLSLALALALTLALALPQLVGCDFPVPPQGPFPPDTPTLQPETPSLAAKAANSKSYAQVYEALNKLYEEQQARYSDYDYDDDGVVYDAVIPMEAPTDTIAAPEVERSPAPTAPTIKEVEAPSNEKYSEDGYSSGSSSDYSETNVQVEGIDEADIVKTDGTNIYILSGSSIVIVRAQGQYTKEIAEIDLEPLVNRKGTMSYYATCEFFVSGNRLIFLYEYSLFERPKKAPSLFGMRDNHQDSTYSNQRAVTWVACYDISSISKENSAGIYDKDALPATSEPDIPLVSVFGQDGSYVSSRLQGDILYLASSHEVGNFSVAKPEKPEGFVPCSYTGDTATVLKPQNITIPQSADTMSYSVVTSLDVKKGERIAQQSVLGTADTLYMSRNNLYLANRVYKNQEQNSYKDGSFTVTEVQSGFYTQLLKFSIEKGAIKFKAQSIMPGELLNQFSLDEYEGHLRLVTTVDLYQYRTITDEKGSFFEQDNAYEPHTNALFVLDRNLELVGSVEGLAKDERVYSVRFAGPVGYFVTFRQVDPLFTVDLSDPKAPEVKSALKIPGFSTYLHEYAPNRLFGLGEAADEDGFIEGLKLSMFDTTNLHKVSEKHRLAVGEEYWYAEALDNHKALLIDPKNNLIGFASEDRYLIYGYSDAQGFYLRASLPIASSYHNQYRGLYINDYFYVCSAINVDVYALKDFSLQRELELTEYDGFNYDEPYDDDDDYWIE